MEILDEFKNIYCKTNKMLVILGIMIVGIHNFFSFSRICGNILTNCKIIKIKKPFKQKNH